MDLPETKQSSAGQPEPPRPIDVLLDDDQRLRLRDLLIRPRLLDRGALATLTELLAAERHLEDAIGAAPLAGSLRTQLAAMELCMREARGAVRDDALRLGSEFAQFTGWLHTAVNDTECARGSIAMAWRLARERDDPHMQATALSMSGYLDFRSRRFDATLQYSLAAASDVRVARGLRALAAQQAGRACAALGRADECERHFDTALEHAQRAADLQEDEPPWNYYFSEAHLQMQRGRAYRYLGRSEEAARLLRTGLDGLPLDFREAEWTSGYRAHLDAAISQQET